MAASAQGDFDTNNSVTNQTISKRCGDVHRWQEYLVKVWKEDDTFLESISIRDRFGKSDYVRCFLIIYRLNGFGTKRQGKIGTPTIHRALKNISSHFENEGHPDPVRNTGGKLNPKIDKLLKAYKLEDPAPKRQPPLPLTFFKQFLEMKSTPLVEAISQLFCGGLFFGMRSCEYSQPDEENPRTELLTVDDVKFYDEDGNEMKSNRKNAAYVKITFRNQKNSKKMESQIRLRSSTNSKLCLVRIWASVIDRILSYDNTSGKTKVNTVIVDGLKTSIRSSTVQLHVKTTVTIIGKDALKVKASEIGTHTLRTSFATMLWLKKTDPKEIMILGRWLSNAFMKYIRRTVILTAGTDNISNPKNNNIRRLI